MNWPLVALNSVSILITKGTTPTTNGDGFAENGIPFLRVWNLKNGLVDLSADRMYLSKKDHDVQARSKIYPGDLLVSIAGSIGRVAVADNSIGEMNCNQAIAIVRLSKAVDRRFALHWMQSSHAQRQMASSHVTGTITNLSLTELGKLQIPLPPIREQQRVATILDQAETIQTKRRFCVVKLDALPQSIFLSTFGARVDKQEWPIAPLGELIEGFESGKSLVADDEDACTQFRVLKVSAVGKAGFNANESKPLPEGYIPPKAHMVRKHDLLFSRANTAELVGATAYVWDAPSNLALPDKLWRFKWRSDSKIMPLFVHRLFQQVWFREEISRKATGTSGSMKNIAQEKVLSIRIPIPSIALQEQFSKRTELIRGERKEVISSSIMINRLIASLRHRAFEGGL